MRPSVIVPGDSDRADQCFFLVWFDFYFSKDPSRLQHEKKSESEAYHSKQWREISHSQINIYLKHKAQNFPVDASLIPPGRSGVEDFPVSECPLITKMAATCSVEGKKLSEPDYCREKKKPQLQLESPSEAQRLFLSLKVKTRLLFFLSDWLSCHVNQWCMWRNRAFTRLPGSWGEWAERGWYINRERGGGGGISFIFYL